MVHVVKQPNGTVVELGPEYHSLDPATIGRIAGQLLAAADGADPPRLIIDMARTTFIGSQFIELLFRAQKRIARRGGVMVLCGVHDFCAEVLHVARLDSLWPIHPTRDQALAAFEPRPRNVPPSKRQQPDCSS